MNALGTILPTAESEAINDRYAAEQARLNAKFAYQSAVLASCRRKIVGGETRYYLRANIYATVRNQTIRWFEVRKDGDYALKGNWL